MKWPACSVLLIALVTTACHAPCRGGSPVLGPDLCKAVHDPHETARLALLNWLECEECSNGELAVVVHYGPLLIPMLQAATLSGPSPASEELLREAFGRRYDELRDYALVHPESPISGTREQFVAFNVSRAHVQYQLRAAQALALIGGPLARQTILDAIGRAERADLKAGLQAALAQMQ